MELDESFSDRKIRIGERVKKSLRFRPMDPVLMGDRVKKQLHYPTDSPSPNSSESSVSLDTFSNVSSIRSRLSPVTPKTPKTPGPLLLYEQRSAKRVPIWRQSNIKQWAIVQKRPKDISVYDLPESDSDGENSVRPRTVRGLRAGQKRGRSPASSVSSCSNKAVLLGSGGQPKRRKLATIQEKSKENGKEQKPDKWIMSKFLTSVNNGAWKNTDLESLSRGIDMMEIDKM